MKKVTESTTPATINNLISIIEIPGYRNSLRAMMDGYFLHCAENGVNPEPAYCAFKAIDSMLEKIYSADASDCELKQAVGM